MGEIVGAGLVSHVPPIVMSLSDRRLLNDGEDFSLCAGLERLRTERLDELRPDVIVVFDTHWFSTFEHICTAHERRSGLFTSDELPRGMCQMPYDIPGDPELAFGLAALAEARDDTWVLACDDPHLPIHYPTVNLLGYLQGDEAWVSVSICQTAVTEDFLLLGELLAAAVARLDRRVVLLASGGLSHRFWPLRELRAHESADLQNISSAEARAADEHLIEQLRAGDHAGVLAGVDGFRRHAPEGFFGHYLMMVGALGGAACRAPGEMFSAYESAAGTGQAHIWFDRPGRGWEA
ncbi:MAG: catechol 1,2-dioxygenase [bacterium]|nr:catechol 1,2-dioxygenase [bacterium]